LGVAYFLIVYFQFQPPYIGFAFFFVLEPESLLNQLRLGIPKSVGAQLSACFILSTQVQAGPEETLLSLQLRF